MQDHPTTISSSSALDSVKTTNSQLLSQELWAGSSDLFVISADDSETHSREP